MGRRTQDEPPSDPELIEELARLKREGRLLDYLEAKHGLSKLVKGHEPPGGNRKGRHPRPRVPRDAGPAVVGGDPGPGSDLDDG